MKIGFLANCYPPHVVGGAEIAVRHLAEACRNLGHQVFVVTLNPEDLDTQDEIGGVRVYRLRTRNFYWPFAPAKPRGPLKKVLFHLRDQYNQAAARSIREIMVAERPDVASTHNLPGFSVSVWAMFEELGIPVVHTLHDYQLMCVKSTRFRQGKVCLSPCATCKIASVIRKAETSKVASVVGVSSHVLGRHVDAGYFRKAEQSVVYNGLPLSAGEKATRKLGETFRVGFIGRVEQAKGIEILLEAFSGLAKVPMELHIAGRGEPGYLRNLQDRYPDPRVRYLGFVDPSGFYGTVDVVVVPSMWEEPLGLVAIEPLEHGVPVIGSRIGGIAELVQHGVTGLLFEPGDVAGLARSLMSVQGGSLGAECTQACRAARGRYLPERSAREMCDIFQRAITPAPAQANRDQLPA